MIKVDTHDFDIKFPALQLKHISRIKRIVQKTALKVVSNSKSKAPVKTGYLRNTINSKYSDSNGRIEANISTNAFYDIFNEKRKPFFKPSLDKEVQNFIREIKGALR